MFGYIAANYKQLSPADKTRYQHLYCGLCHALGSEYGFVGRMTLTYDMTFVSMLLSSVYDLPESAQTIRCPANPLRKCPIIHTEATTFAADMNLLLAYYKSVDDWRDDHNLLAFSNTRLLEKRLAQATAHWPRQAEHIQKRLAQLTLMERANELNPDIPANCFGDLMGVLFLLREDEHSKDLYQFGATLGRFIYMMDAVMDLRDDIRKKRYNPLAAQLNPDYTAMLTMLIGDSTTIFERLKPQRDSDIMRNILYSGVWVRYFSKRAKNEADRAKDEGERAVK